MTSDRLILNAQVKVSYETDIDVVEYFSALNKWGRTGYFAVDLAEWGCDADFERPLAFLMSELSDTLEGFAPAKGLEISAFSGEPEWETGPSVIQRAGERIFGQDRYWTQDDYEHLLAEVSWMRPEVQVESNVHPDQGELDL